MRRPFLCALVVFLAGLASSQAATHRVALSTFTSDENTWEALQAAESVAPALQGLLGTVPGIEWVERPDLGLIFQERALVSNLGNSIRQARLAHADWMIFGRFVKAKGPRELVLEVIDLAHADVLVEQHLALTAASVREAAGQLPALATGVRAALVAAAKREGEVAGRPSIAVLFFPDLDVFQTEFQAALEDPQLGAGPYRVLRLPRAAASSGEAELALAGFTDDTGAWRGIADAYVWGSLKKRASGSIDAVTITDARTPDISLHVWDGRLSPRQLEEESEPVERRKFDEAVRGQARRLAGSLADFMRHPRAGEKDEGERARVARGLLRAVDDLERNKANSANYLNSQEGRRHYLNVVQTLESACFLDPQNPEAMRQLIDARYGLRVRSQVPDRFRFAMGRREAWGRYVDRFGLTVNGVSRQERIQVLMKQPVVDHEEISRLMRGLPVPFEYLESACEAFRMGTYGNREEQGYPTGVPEAEARKWEDALAREVARRTLQAAGYAEANPLQGLAVVFNNRGPKTYSIIDPKFRVQWLQEAAPALRTSLRQGLQPELRKYITQSYVDAGRSGGERALFALFDQPEATVAASTSRPPAPPAATAPEIHTPPGLFRYKAIEVPAPELPVPIEKLAGLDALSKVSTMVMLDGRLWLIGEGIDDTPLAGPNPQLLQELGPASETVKRLHVLDLAERTTHLVEAARRLSPSSLFVHEGLLWVAFGRDGVAVIEPRSESMRRFGKEDGLDVASAYRFAVADSRLFVTTDEHGLHVYDATTQRWNAHPTARKEFTGLAWGGNVRHVAGLGPWLLHSQGPMAIEDLRTGAWKSYHALQVNERVLQMFSGAGAKADATGFWNSSETGLSHLDPATGRLTEEMPVRNTRIPEVDPSTVDVVASLSKERAMVRPESAAIPPWQAVGRIPGPIQSMLPDGDFLWIAAAPFLTAKTNLMLWHQPSRRWVGQYFVLGEPALAADEKYLWFTVAARVPASRGTREVANLCRVEKRLLYTNLTVPPATEARARAAYDALPVRDRAFHSFDRGRYGEAAALFAQVPPERIDGLGVEPAAEALYMLALCYDAQGLKEPAKQRAFLEQLVTRFPEEYLVEDARRQLGALGAK